VDAGGFAQAAERLHKSQSSVTYSVQKLQRSLNVRAFNIEGRKAVLTDEGQMLYRRAKALLDEASTIERAARTVSRGWESELTLAVEVLFPTWLMLDCLARFGEEHPLTRIEWFETVIDETREALESGRVDIGITPRIPDGFHGELLMEVSFSLVASPDHPLHKLKRKVTQRDLRKHRHVVVRDNSSRRDKRAVSVEVEQRWTVSNMATLIGALTRGYGFAWLPLDKIRNEINRAELKALSVEGLPALNAQLFIVFPDADATGPAAKRLAQIIRQEVGRRCEARE
jgi:DNA-binding transcriptional LysR family regulator